MNTVLRRDPTRAGDRRAVLRAVGAAVLCGAVPTWGSAHDSFGPVRPPQATPAISLLSLDGTATDLPSLLRGKITAAQLMFTGCSATCPIQGAIFSEVQRRLASAPDHFQLLSLSIDALGDDPKALRAWLRRYAADPTRWTAAVSTPRDVDLLIAFLGGRATGGDQHTPQVYLFDRQGRLRYRTSDLPPATAVVQLMNDLAALG